MSAEAIEAMRSTPEYKRMTQMLIVLQKMRHGVIKRYFDKYKYRKNHRNEIIQAAEETENAFRETLKEDFVHLFDAYPEIREFLEQVNRD